VRGLAQHVTRVDSEYAIAPDALAGCIDDANPVRITIERDAGVYGASRLRGLAYSGLQVSEILRLAWIGLAFGKRSVAFAKKARSRHAKPP